MQQGCDINLLRKEAQSRWLKPAEVLSILQNYKHFPLTQEPPDRPQSGSLFLFNRRILRFFRKDGHAWRRKKDGRTVGEAHERLKVGNVDALNCYYAHGEQNPYFQRRSFWMLDPAYDHIVLVHYLDVSEGRYVSGSISNLSPESYYASTSNINNGFTIGNSDSYEPYQNSYSPGSVEEVNSKFVIENFEPKNTRTTEVNQELRKLAQQLSLDDDVNYYNDNTIGSNASEDFTHGDNELSEPYLSPYEAGTLEETHHRFLDGNFWMNHSTTSDNDQSSKPQVNQALRKLEQQLSLESLDDDGHLVHLEEPLPTYSRKEGQSHLGFLRYEQREQKTRDNIYEGLEVRAHGQVNEVGGCQSYASTHLAKVSGDNGSEQSEGLYTKCGIETKEYSSWTDMLKLSSTSTGTSTYGTPEVLAMNGIPESSNCRDQRCSLSEKTSADLFLQSENMPWNREDNKFAATQETSDLSLQLSATRKFLLGSDNYEDYLTRNIPLQSNSRNEATIDRMGSLNVGDIAYSSDFSSTLFGDVQSQSSLGIDSNLTLAQTQQFSIREICPEWAYAGDNTKVIITGDFLCNPTKLSWKAMFGDIEVPLQIIQEGVFRCQTPQCGIGKVTMCITSGNRESCSEIREFEFRPKPSTTSYSGILPTLDTTPSSDELLLLARLVQILLYGFDGPAVAKGINPQVENSVKLKLGNHWQQMIESLNSGCANSIDTLEWIVEELLKDKLPHWLSSKDQHDEQTNCSLSKQELGIIHMISGLGYEWALSSILNTGVSVNFRDANGWTALHWAAYYGREKMVAALLAAGASPGAVTDPTSQDPVGKTPGFLASSRGHKGLAGYLSEVALTSHLSSLTVEETEISKVSAEVEAEKAIENISQKGVEMHGETEDELSLKDSLAAVRNAAQAAARIQAAFRAHSFRRRQQVVAFRRDDYGMTPRDIQELSAASKYHRSLHGQDQRFDKAALSIQKNYRGWKGHKEFLTLKKNVVKIQAHVRGHQVRKKYRDLIFTVSFVEKAILRWRRKGVGLRGFRAEQEAEPEMVEDEEDEEDIAKVFRKQKVDAALDEAVSRVLSMVDSPDARQQYRRMIERYHEAKAELSSSDEGASKIKSDFEVMDNDMY